MRRFAAKLSTTLLATTVVASVAHVALAQSTPPPPPGQIGPSPTNPMDTGNGAMPGTNPSGTTTIPQPNAGTVPNAGSVPVTPLVPVNPVVPNTTGQLTGRPPQQGLTPAQPVSPNLPPATAIATAQLPDALRARSGGMTADSAAVRALRLNWSVEAARASVAAAEAQQVETGRQMIPNLTGSFRYTRLSPYTVGTIAFPNYGAALVGLQHGDSSFLNMCAPSFFAAPQCGQAIPLTTAILDQYDLRVTLTVPISDIPLRLARLYEAAGLSAEAARMQVEYQRALAGQTARVAFYEYLRAVGQAAVADAALDAARRRQSDVSQAVSAGTMPRAQQLAVDAQVAGLQRQSDVGHNLVTFAEARLRQVLHMRADEPITLGEALDEQVTLPTNLADLIQRAMNSRPDVRSIERQARAVDANVAATRASQFPSLTGVGNFDYINPNTRVFPQVQRFDPTWDATIQLSWSPTQAFVADATIARLRAQRAQLVAQQQAAREGAEMEVRQYYMNAVNAQSALAADRANLASAEEAYRVARERVSAGAAVATDLAAAESDLMAARFNVVNASVDLREQLAYLRRAAGDPEPGENARDTRH